MSLVNMLPNKTTSMFMFMVMNTLDKIHNYTDTDRDRLHICMYEQ